MRLSMISAALVAALVGYGSTIALVLAAAQAVGATQAQTASWLLAVCLAKGVGSALLSWRTRVPVVLAWSTPGAALIAASSGITMPEAVGAFVVAGALIALTGVLRPLGRLVAQIPDGIAAAMLAGVLLPFCLKGWAVSGQLGATSLILFAVFAVMRRANPAFAVLATLGAGVILAFGPGRCFLSPWPAKICPVLPPCAPQGMRRPWPKRCKRQALFQPCPACLAPIQSAWLRSPPPSAWATTFTPNDPSVGKWALPMGALGLCWAWRGLGS